MGKLTTPDRIKEDFNSKEEWEKANGKKTAEKKAGKIYRVKKCPNCGSTEVSVVLSGEEGRRVKNEWECKACKWKGKNIDDQKLSEDKFLEQMEKMDNRPSVADLEGK